MPLRRRVVYVSLEEESDDSRAAARRRPPASRRLADGSDDDEDDEDEDENGGGAGSRGKGAAGRGFDGGDDDDDDDEPEAKRMVEDVHGEEDEDEHYERTNEAGDPMEPFNLRNERDMGYFDTNGNFVWKREEHERDAWLAEMDEGTMEEAIGAASNRAAKDEDTSTPARRAGAGDAPLRGDSLAGMSTVEMRDALIPLLEEGEAVTQALRRLGKRRKGEAGPARDRRRPGSRSTTERSKKSTAEEDSKHPASPAEPPAAPSSEAAHGEQQNGSGGKEENGSVGGKGDGVSTGNEAVDEAEESKRREAFGRLTDLADGLLQAGQHDIYQQTREDLEEAAEEAVKAEAARAWSSGSYFGGAMGGATEAEQVQQERWMRMQQQQQQPQYQAAMAEGSAGADETAFFEYRGKDGNVHGPYGASQMKGWVQQGYFDGDQAVMMRKIPSADGQIPPVGGGAASGAAANASGSGATPASNADLMADLDDDEEEEEENEEKGSAREKAGEGGSGGSVVGHSEEWVHSDGIDWSLY